MHLETNYHKSSGVLNQPSGDAERERMFSKPKQFIHQSFRNSMTFTREFSYFSFCSQKFLGLNLRLWLEWKWNGAFFTHSSRLLRPLRHQRLYALRFEHQKIGHHLKKLLNNTYLLWMSFSHPLLRIVAHNLILQPWKKPAALWTDQTMMDLTRCYHHLLHHFL